MKLKKQYDSMQCGMVCLQMVSEHYGQTHSVKKYPFFVHRELSYLPLPCILHWNQNHFVVLYKVKKGKKFYVADPGKGLVKYNLEEFKIHWISTRSNGEEKGIAMFLEPTPVFYSHKEDDEGEKNKNPRSFRFLFDYVKKYIRYFGQIVLGLIVGSLPSAIPSR